MTARVILGSRGGQYGLWVSKPGLDANSTNDEDFLLTPNRPLVQPAYQGRISADGTKKVNLKIVHGFGYIPICLVFGQIQVYPSTPPQIVQIRGSLIDTNALHIANSDDNIRTFGSTTYFAMVDATYVIFRTMMTAS